MADLINRLDQQLAAILAGYNVYTGVIVALILGLITLIVVTATDPDTHPMLLARAASPSPVRQPGESAVYRAHDVSHGLPLRTGLNVKHPKDPPYASGRDGTLKDIWNRFTGALPLSDPDVSEETKTTPGVMLTVLGKDVHEHRTEDITREINIIGKHIKDAGAPKVAVYLPNSVELLATIFAGACYGFTVVPVPFNQPHDMAIDILRRSDAEFLIAEAGSLPLASVTKGVPKLREAVWCVEVTSRHVDWKEVPSDVGGSVEVSVWHELVQDHLADSSSTLPDGDVAPGSILSVWQDKPGSAVELVEFSPKNIIAGVGAAVASLGMPQRLKPSDMFLPVESLAHVYTLVQTLAALFQKSTVALNSVAGEGVGLREATQAIAPTVVAASAETAANMHAEYTNSLTGPIPKIRHALATRTLAGGTMPQASSAEPGKLRLLLVSERAGCPSSPHLSERVLSDLRAATGARVVRALTASKVAGAVAQTGVYDYRVDAALGEEKGHFGPPSSALEIKVVDTPRVKTTDESAQGEMVVSGPAVVGSEANLGLLARFRDDHCLAFL